MRFFGISIDPVTIRVSQWILGRSEPRFEPVCRDNYGLEKWYSRYQGSLPNRIAERDGSVGYDALDAGGKDSLGERFFRSLLDVQTRETAASVWRRVVKEIRRNYMKGTDSATVALYLDGIELSSGRSFSFWRPASIRRPDLESVLLAASADQLHRLMIIEQHDALACLTDLHAELLDNDLLVDIGYSHLAYWRVQKKPPSAKLVEKVAGIERLKGVDGDIPDTLARAAVPGELLPAAVRQWQQEELLHSCRHALGHVGRETIQRLVIAGEGAALFVDEWQEDLNKVVHRLPDERFLNSFAAAAYAYRHANIEGAGDA